MKRLLKLFVLTLMLFIQSCSEPYRETRTLIKSTSKVLKKEEIGGRYVSYKIYIFDGESSEWYDIEHDLYNSINEGDSLSTITLKIIRYTTDN